MLQLICRSTSCPLTLKPSGVSGNGTYIYNDSEGSCDSHVTPASVCTIHTCGVMMSYLTEFDLFSLKMLAIPVLFSLL